MRYILLIIFTFCLSFSTKAQTSFISDVNSSVDNFIAEWLYTPYQYGGYSKSGIDCSGLVQIMAKDIFGIDIPRTTTTQMKNVKKVNIDSIKTGDLVFFKSKYSPSGYHVGFYLWNNLFMHAARKGVGVIISDLDQGRIYMIGRLYSE